MEKSKKMYVTAEEAAVMLGVLCINGLCLQDYPGTEAPVQTDLSILLGALCEPIPPEALRHVFEPFYRPDYARSREDGGNGLGLYLVDMLLGAMGLSYSFRQMEQPTGMRFVIHL